MVDVYRDELAAVDATLAVFGRRVRDERLHRGLSLSAFAATVPSRRVGSAGRMSEGMVGAIERASRTPTLTHALAIAEALGVPLADLLTDRPAAGRHCAACETNAAHARRHRELLAVSA